jgi:hypothetical protein
MHKLHIVNNDQKKVRILIVIPPAFGSIREHTPMRVQPISLLYSPRVELVITDAVVKRTKLPVSPDEGTT